MECMARHNKTHLLCPKKSAFSFVSFSWSHFHSKWIPTEARNVDLQFGHLYIIVALVLNTTKKRFNVSVFCFHLCITLFYHFIMWFDHKFQVSSLCFEIDDNKRIRRLYPISKRDLFMNLNFEFVDHHSLVASLASIYYFIWYYLTILVCLQSKHDFSARIKTTPILLLPCTFTHIKKWSILHA